MVPIASGGCGCDWQLRLSSAAAVVIDSFGCDKQLRLWFAVAVVVDGHGCNSRLRLRVLVAVVVLAVAGVICRCSCDLRIRA